MFTQVGGEKAGSLWLLATGGRLLLLSADLHLQNTECPGSRAQQLGPGKLLHQLSLNLQQHQEQPARESRGRLPGMGKRVPIG